MALLFSNLAKSTIAAAVLDTDTEIQVQAGDGIKFPVPSGSDYFVLVLETADRTSYEVCHCTVVDLDTLTVTRAQEGTNARGFAIGDRAEIRVTAGTLATLQTTGGGVGDVTEERVKDLVDAAFASFLEPHVVAGNIVFADEARLRQAMDELP